MNAYELRDTTGRGLSDDLAMTLRVGRERQLAFVECEMPGGGRADVLTINPVYSKRQDVRVYEVKTNRRDFHGDVNSAKFEKYLTHARRVYFACPTGLVKKEEVPAYCGLIVRGDKGWRVVKPAPPQDAKPLPADWLVTLMDRAFFKDLPAMRRLADRVVMDENRMLRPHTYHYGRDVAAKLASVDSRVTMTEDDRRKLDLANEVLGMLEAAGVKHVSEYSARMLAETACDLMREASSVREIGAWLSHYHERSAGAIRELLAKP